VNAEELIEPGASWLVNYLAVGEADPQSIKFDDLKNDDGEMELNIISVFKLAIEKLPDDSLIVSILLLGSG